MYVLKDLKCSECGSEIAIIGDKSPSDLNPVVSHGVCIVCQKSEVLPPEDLAQFVSENCVVKKDLPIAYAGIGSRETPEDIQNLFSRVASYLSGKGLVLRSGGAPGADQAFERGCDSQLGEKEIFLPWKGFEGSTSALVVKEGPAFEIAKEYHPSWDRLSRGAQLLQARNSHQVLGATLKQPASFVLCWTKGGKGSGGTGQALRIATAFDIPIFDAGAYTDIGECRRELNAFLKPFLLKM